MTAASDVSSTPVGFESKFHRGRDGVLHGDGDGECVERASMLVCANICVRRVSKGGRRCVHGQMRVHTGKMRRLKGVEERDASCDF